MPFNHLAYRLFERFNATVERTDPGSPRRYTIFVGRVAVLRFLTDNKIVIMHINKSRRQLHRVSSWSIRSAYATIAGGKVRAGQHRAAGEITTCLYPAV